MSGIATSHALVKHCLTAVALAVWGMGCGPSSQPSAKSDVHGYSALHRLAMSNDVAQVEKLAREHADVNALDQGGVAPLHRAARDGLVQLTEMLLKYGADPNLKTRQGWTALHLAVMKGRGDTAELLLRWGADVMTATPSGDAPIHMAIKAGRNDLLQLLITFAGYTRPPSEPAAVTQAGAQGHADGSASTASQETATEAGDAKKRLVNLKDGKGTTPLQLAIERKDGAMAASLLLNGANPNEKDAQGRLPLIRAIEAGDSYLVSVLLGNGAEPNLRDDKGESAYGACVRVKRADLADQVWRKGGR